MAHSVAVLRDPRDQWVALHGPRPADQVAPAVDFSTLGVGCRAGSLAEESG